MRKRWVHGAVNVPTNPSAGRALLFVPQRFIRDLPTLNADEWWDSFENAQLRQDLNYHIMGKVSKDTIVAAARQNPVLVREWMAERENQAAKPYDLGKDPNGVWQWDRKTQQFTDQHPLALSVATDHESFCRVIDEVVQQFRLYVEEEGGWFLLWNDNSEEKPEEAAQLLFRGIVQHYCRANNISIDREVELGRGPVDFKFSNGYRHRALLEIKKLHNGKFWNGLEEQLPSYMRSDQVKDGWFLAVRYRDGKAATRRAKSLPTRVAQTVEATDLDLRFALVDARRPVSASNIKTRTSRVFGRQGESRGLRPTV